MSLRVTPSESVMLRKISICASEIVWVLIMFVHNTASLQLGVVRPPCRCNMNIGGDLDEVE